MHRLTPLALTFLIALSVAHAASVMAGVGSHVNLAGDDIEVKGKVFNDAGVGAGAGINVALNIYNSTWSSQVEATTTSDGEFLTSIVINAPGTYHLVASALGASSPVIDFDVVSREDPITAKFWVVNRSIVIQLSLSHSITSSDLPYQSMWGGSENIESKTYYFLVNNSTGLMYVGERSQMNVSDPDVISNLHEDSRVKLGNTSWKVSYISPAGNIVVLSETVKPVFRGGENVNILAVSLNSNGVNATPRTLNVSLIRDDGSIVGTPSPAKIADGVYIIGVQVPASSGLYHVVWEKLGSMTFSVENIKLSAEVWSIRYAPKWVFTPGEKLLLSLLMKNQSDQRAISEGNVSAKISGKNYEMGTELRYNESMGVWLSSEIAAPSETGKYDVLYTAAVGGAELHAYSSFEVKSYDVFLHAFSAEREVMEALPPGKQAYLVVSAVNTGTGNLSDVSNLTGNRRENFNFTLLDSSGRRVIVDWNVTSLNDALDELQAPPWIRSMAQEKFGNASVINFTTPKKTGVYEAVVRVNLSGFVEARLPIGVQHVYVTGDPVTMDGMFSPVISPGSNVTLRLWAFDLRSWSQVQVNDAGLIEVTTETGKIVTDMMENPRLITLGDGSKALTFRANDSISGFHHVKLWANVTLDDAFTTAIGDGWFESRYYFVWAYPEKYSPFGSNSSVRLIVEVRDRSFNPPSTYMTVRVDEVRYIQTYEPVDIYASDINASCTVSSSNANCTLSITPKSPWRSGPYDVSVSVSGMGPTGEYITEYGHGWFDVRNFMFWAYSQNWEVMIGEQISLNAGTQLFDGSQLNAAIKLREVIYHGTYDKSVAPVITAVNKGLGTCEGSCTLSYGGEEIRETGMYELVLDASNSTYGTETAHVWIYASELKVLVSAVNEIVGVGENLTIMVDGRERGYALNKSETNITKVMKLGARGGEVYRTQDELSTSVEYEGGSQSLLNISLSLTGWDAGDYVAKVKVVDMNGRKAFEDVYFTVKVANVGVTEIFDVWIPKGREFSNISSFSVTTRADKATEDTCPGFSKPDNLSINSYVGSVTLGEDLGKVGLPYATLYALVDVDNKSVWFNASSCDFRNATKFTIGDLYTDPLERRWNVSEIRSDGTVVLKGDNVIASGHRIDLNLSKSGKFLVSYFYDNEWLGIDLDNNGTYYSDIYTIILADRAESGVYDTVYVCNSSDCINNSVNASAGAVGFNNTPKPIYLISVFETPYGFDVRFSSWRVVEWGYWIGTFGSGKNVTVPFIVTKPNGDPIENAEVRVDYLTWYIPGTYVPVDAGAKTDSNGLALVSFSTAEVPTGQYLVHYNVSLPEGNYISPSETWRLPMIEVRTFIINAELGYMGRIQLMKITDEQMYMQYGVMLPVSEDVPYDIVDRGDWTNVYELYGPFHGWYYNFTTGKFYNFNGTEFINETDPGNMSLEMGGITIDYEVERKPSWNDTTNCTISGETICNEVWAMNVTSYSCKDGGSVDMTIIYLPWGPWPYSYPGLSVGSTLEVPGPARFSITSIGCDGTVNISLIDDIFIARVKEAKSLTDGNLSNGEVRGWRISLARSGSYDFIGYDDRVEDYSSMAEMGGGVWGWSPSMDSLMVVDRSTNSSSIYRLGQSVQELTSGSGEFYVALVSKWGGRVMLVNKSVTSVFPFPDWTPDGLIFYAGNFSEADVSVDLDSSGNVSADKVYVMLAFDDYGDGVAKPASVIWDDDVDLSELWMQNDGEGLTMLDMFGTEGGKIGEMHTSLMMPGFTYPFGITDITLSSNAANLTTFARKEFYTLQEDVHIYLRASYLNGTPLSGNASLKNIMMILGVDENGEMIGGFTMLNISAPERQVVDGQGEFVISNQSIINAVRSATGKNLGAGMFILTVKITDDLYGTSETTQLPFMMGDPNLVKPPQQAPPGGGGY